MAGHDDHAFDTMHKWLLFTFKPNTKQSVFCYNMSDIRCFFEKGLEPKKPRYEERGEG